MRIPDEQLGLFEQRLQAIGVGRRDFLKAVGAMAAFGGLGFATTAEAAKPTKPAPGDKLAKEQVFRYGGGVWYGNEPSSQDGDKWPEAANIVPNGPFVLDSWEHNKQMTLRKNPYYFGAKNVHLTKVVIPIIPPASGALPYENNELDMTSLQAGDLKRLQTDPRASKDVFRYPFPG